MHKISDKKAQIYGFQHYFSEFTKTDPGYLYIVNIINTVKDENVFGQNCPKHIIILGDTLQSESNLPGNADTIIQIPINIPVEELFKIGNALIADREEWYNSLLMAVINHKPINVFLNIAAQAMPNPIIVMNNNLSILSSAGSIKIPTEGTIWEKVHRPGFVMEDFYTPNEIKKISLHVAQKSEEMINLFPKNDPAHSTIGIHTWIDGKLYGGIGAVDMNVPFTEGQKETLFIIAGILKLYFQNHSIYMQITENKTNWLNSLLDGVDISADIISNYLQSFQWKLNDRFCMVTFSASSGLKVPILSILDIKHINDLFPDALVSVYEDYVIMIMRCHDEQLLNGKNKELLEKFLKKDAILQCGVSMVFNNFLHLRYYYNQSKFAAAQCKPSLNPVICFYEDYQAEHVVQTLSLGGDPRCFCHPGILSLWESGNESQRELVHSIYHYFLNGKSISIASDALHVHRNTLIYRLDKAEEILNIDVKQGSSKQAFLFIISCMIVQFLKT
ncbi:MAG: helix-turn-helix domain-containing protein [Treponema sp.]|nr:helix-turn-helix domain-containing protein [Treponema sp.]